jgi:hypothetical protein
MTSVSTAMGVVILAAAVIFLVPSSVISIVVPPFRHLLYFIYTFPISRFLASKQTMYVPPSIHACPSSLHNLMNYVVMNQSNALQFPFTLGCDYKF